MKYSFSYSVPARKPTADQLVAQAQALEKGGQLEAAVSRYEQALVLDPNHLNSLQLLGALSLSLGAFERAKQCFGKVNAHLPGFAQAYRYRGLAFASLLQFEDALRCFDKAVSLAPEHVGGWFNRAVALQSLLRLDDAIAAYEDIVRKEPAHEQARWNLGICHLLNGDLLPGFELFENRWKNESFRQHQGGRVLHQPQWKGHDSLHGKTLFVHAEQGLGDTIQFVRYVKLLAKSGVRVVCEVQPTLLSLVKSMDAPVEWMVRGEPIPAHDLQSPLLSLPAVLKTELASIPSERAYLFPDQGKLSLWSARLDADFGKSSGLRVGLVWQGSTTHANDAQRSLSLDVLKKALPSKVQYVALQKDLSDADLAALSGWADIVPLGRDFADFGDTAAVCASLDVVVSVDTSVAHLAGALGKPVWLMLPHEPDWRWLLNRNDSPWYPSARLLRQKTPGDWSNVLTDLAQALIQLRHDKGFS